MRSPVEFHNWASLVFYRRGQVERLDSSLSLMPSADLPALLTDRPYRATRLSHCTYLACFRPPPQRRVPFARSCLRGSSSQRPQPWLGSTASRQAHASILGNTILS